MGGKGQCSSFQFYEGGVHCRKVVWEEKSLFKTLRFLSFLGFLGVLTACGPQTELLNLRYQTVTNADDVPELILLVSMTPTGSDFKISARFCTQPVTEAPCTQFKEFIEVTSTQRALLACAAFLGYVSDEDKQKAPFNTLTINRAACADSLKTALLGVLPPGTQAPTDPLVSGGMNLLNNSDGFVFVISIHDLSQSNPCFQVAAVKVKDAAFESPLTTQMTSSGFVFFVGATAGAEGNTLEQARERCFPYS